jgi:hypothetical protein
MHGCSIAPLYLSRGEVRTMALHFDPIKVKEAARDVSRVQLDPAQEQLIKELADFVAPRIGLDVIPCRGLWLQASRCWQVEHRETTDAISRLLPSERKEAAREIAAHFGRLAREMLSDASQASALDAALGEAFRLYMEKYNRRGLTRGPGT